MLVAMFSTQQHTDVELPLSAAQRAIWIDLQLSPGRAPFYNNTQYIELNGPIDTSLLEQAVREATLHSGALRARFVCDDREVRQILQGSLDLQIERHDFSAEPDANEAALAWMNRERRKWIQPLDAHLMRFAVLRVSSDKMYLYTQLHHLLIDGIGIKLWMECIATAYTALLEGKQPGFENDLPLFTAYIDNDATYAASEQCAIDREFWIKQRTAPASLSVRRRVVDSTLPFQTQTLYLPRELAQALIQLAQQLKLGVPQLMISSVALFLSRALDRDELSVGLPMHGRVENWMRPLIAMCSNVLPVSFQLDRDRPVVECLLKAHAQMAAATAHRRTRYDEIRRLQNIRVGDLGHYDIVINALPFAIGMPFGESSGRARNLSALHVPDLTLWLFVGSTGDLAIKVDAHSAKYERWEADAHLHNLVQFLQHLVRGSVLPLDRLAMLPQTDFEALAGGADSSPNQASWQPVHALIEARVDANPAATAVICGEQSLSFQTLDHKANRIANALLAQGLGAEHRVAILMDRSLELPAAVLGVLKSGAAFVPLDTQWPKERLRYALQHSKPSAVIADSALPADGLGCDCPVLRIQDTTGESHERPRRSVSAADLAYCIYTSGTTGHPKAVAVEHGSMLNHVCEMAQTFGLNATDHVLQFFSFAFDQWLEEVLPTLVRGATLVVSPRSAISVDALCNLIARQQVTVAHLPVSYWHVLSSELARAAHPLPTILRLVNIGGESVLTESYRRWMSIPAADRIELLNTYGPTEAAVTSTVYRLITDDRERPISIGRPIGGVACYVLDQQLQPCPPGIVGELCIGGAGLARGYLGDESQTAQKFVDCTIQGTERRIYRTGDLARYRSDGALELLGRNDRQIKLRGHRIELDEIETVLAGHAKVAQCAIVLRPSEHQSSLVAFVVPHAIEANENGWREHLVRVLPDYMIPARFVCLEALPLQTAGKIDRNKLAELAMELPELSIGSIAPRTPSETAVASIFAEALKKSTIGADDDLFALGADSLTAIHVLFRLDEITPRPFTLAELFESRTVARVAARLDELSSRPMLRDAAPEVSAAP